jgi:hypothetical protein
VREPRFGGALVVLAGDDELSYGPCVIVHAVHRPVPIDDKVVLWHDGRHGLEALPLGGQETRHDALVAVLDEVGRASALPPFGPLLIHTNDRPIATERDGWRSYAFCTAPGHVDVPVPDFVFGGWPQVGIHDFDGTCRAMAAAGEQPAHRPVAGWIGNLRTHHVRTVLHRLGETHPDLLDVQQVEWTGVASDGVPLGTSADNAMSLPQQVERWGALVDVEGVGYSGRLKLLLHAGRPVLVADRPWREWYWDGLTPMEHYVPVRRDLSDLVERAEWVRTRPQEADRIGRAGQRFARRVLTRAGAVARWAEVLSLAPHATGEWAPPAVRDALADVLAEIGAMRSAS